MLKTIIGAIVGGIIILVWQTLSYTVLHVHRSAEKYTPNQDSIISYLQTNLHKSGSYTLPNYPDNATMDQQNKLMQDMQGKPWAVILYHRSYNSSMVKNMLYVFFANVIMVWFFCWIAVKMHAPSFGSIFIAAVFTGLIVFINSPLTYHIWYLSSGIKGDLIDAVVSWGLTGLWLGWWLRRGKRTQTNRY